MMDAPDTAASASLRRQLQLRHLRLLIFFGRVLAGIAWWDLILRQAGLRKLAVRTAPARYRRAAARFRALASSLGGVWIKVGQFLSARVDVLPEAITAELAGLQDEVPAQPFETMRRVVEDELGGSLQDHFSHFDPQPLASASLGQVHRARLPGGEAVVVKVQRPDIHALIRVDLAALGTVIGWLKFYRPLQRRANLDALLAEFGRTLWEEVDYRAEAGNAVHLGEMFAQDSEVHIPVVCHSHSTGRVLTLEDVYFIKITDYAAVEAAGLDRGEVARRLLRTYLQQIFREGFFHADPHPGNLFVEPLGDGRWRLVFVDFGMVGRLPPKAKAALRELAIALGSRDAARMLRGLQSLGVLLPGADLERIRQATEAALFDRFWGKSMRELVRIHPREMHALAYEFRDLVFEMPFQAPTDLIYLGRCVAILSGMCTGLDPDFNVFSVMAPFAQGLLAEEEGGWLRVLLEELRLQGAAVLRLPSRLSHALDQWERGEVVVTARAAPEVERRLEAVARATHRLVAAVVFAATLLAAALLYIGGEPRLGQVGLGVALLVLAWIALGSFGPRKPG